MNVGLVGAGVIGTRRAWIVKEHVGFNMVMVADTNFSRAQLLAEEVGCEATTDWKKVATRDDIDIVIVSTPNNLHAPISITAMKNRKHVLCEKPLGTNPDEAKQMVEIALKNNVKLKTGSNHRFHRGIWKARELVNNGSIGEINFIRCRYGHGGRPNYDKEWRAKAELAGGGELLDQGVHVMDLFRWFIGDFSEAVGFITTRFWNVAPLEDNGFALFRTEKGKVASLHVSWTEWRNLFSFEVYGQDGYVLVEGLGGNYDTERLIIGRRLPTLGPIHEETFKFLGQDPSWYEEWRNFVAAIEEDKELLGSGYDGWQALRMVYAIYESSKKSCVVKL